MSGFDVELSTKDLSQALLFCNSVLEKKSSNQVLSNAKIEATDGSIIITVSNETVLLVQKLSGVVKLSGTILLDVSTLLSILKKVDTSTVNIRELDSAVNINTKNTEFKLNLMDYEKFPNFLSVQDYNKSFSIKITEFLELIKYTQFSMLNNDTRNNLKGVCLHTYLDFDNKKKICAASTDGHRLSSLKTENTYEIDDFNVVLPLKLVNHLMVVLQDSKYASSIVDISIDNNKIQIAFDNIVIVSKLIHEKFPDYISLIPNSNDTVAKINCKLFSDSISKVSAVVSNEKSKCIKIQMSKDALLLHAYSEGIGSAKNSVKSSDESKSYYTFDGSEISIGLNSKYVIDIIENMDDSILEIYLKDSASPVLFKSSFLKNGTFVVMPIKIH